MSSDINPPRGGTAVEEAAAASKDEATKDDNFGIPIDA